MTSLYLAYFLLLRLRMRLGWIRTLAICLAGRLVWFLGAAILHRVFHFDTPVTEAAISNWFVWALGAVSVEAFFGIIRLPGWCKNLLTGCALFLLATLVAYTDRLIDPRGLLHEIIWLTILPLWGLAFFVLVNCITSLEINWRAVTVPFGVPRSVRWFSVIGLFSYSLYLTHEIVLVYGGALISHWGGINGNSLVVVRWLVLTPVCLGFAYLFYKWFERPFLNPPSSPVPARTVLSESAPLMTN